MKNSRHLSKKIDIISLYLSDYHRSLTGREVGRMLGWNHQTALTVLTSLVKDNILNKKPQGRNYLYSLNTSLFETSQYLVLAEHLESLKRLQNFEIKKIIQSLLPHCETIIVFGSFAKHHENSESDVDLVIIGPASRNKIDNVKRLFAREINIHYSTWKKFAVALQQKNPLSLEILKSHLLYGNIMPFIEIVKPG